MKAEKYYNLYLKIRNDIESGKYPAGSKLPSKRNMSNLSGYSLITVERAYSMLLEEGYISSRERSGYYVNLIEALNPKNESKINFEYLKEPVAKSKNDFEYSVWFKTVRKVISDYGNLLFVKSPTKGCEILRNAIAEYLFRCRDIKVNPKNIIIGSGAEQLYETAIKLIGRNKVYGIESPCYYGIETVYNANEIKTVPLKMGKDGIEEKELRSKGFDVLHVTPFHSFPSGVTTSIQKRYMYLKWAIENKSYIIEDDFDSEFSLTGNPIQTLFAIDNSSSIVYINTFSKALSPSMRIGYMILPDSLLSKYEEKLESLSCGVPVMDQYILAEFIKSGSFERHINRERRKQNTKTPT